ncbi:gluconokinase [Rhodamnia argentea]|uniref:Gluconokinase n=1 Tax=Rhodamnia argentea TaxID=178133 RepID=A0ABM3HNU6_9MYRT|nr:gluconokinase [Rhodamnia argentea]
MASVQKGSVIVIMGVSGSGKSTIGHMLAEVMECRFLDADDFHPASNKEKMRKGIPLSEEDRIPWLETLQDTLRESLLDGKTAVLGCSALRKHYREILRSADPKYQSGSFSSSVKFVLLDVEAKVLAARLQIRAAEGKHFMPPSLLQSQLELLQVDEAEGILKVDASSSPQAIVANIQASILQCRGNP